MMKKKKMKKALAQDVGRLSDENDEWIFSKLETELSACNRGNPVRQNDGARDDG